jgi:hypothetical protein
MQSQKTFFNSVSCRKSSHVLTNCTFLRIDLLALCCERVAASLLESRGRWMVYSTKHICKRHNQLWIVCTKCVIWVRKLTSQAHMMDGERTCKLFCCLINLQHYVIWLCLKSCSLTESRRKVGIKYRQRCSCALWHVDIWERGGIAPPFLISARDGGEWSASRPCNFTPGIPWIGSWVGPRVCLDALVKRETCTSGNSQVGRWVISFTPLLLYPRYPLDRKLVGPQSRSGLCG